MTGRSVCNDASADCKGVARAVVADQAALDARKKSRQAKSNAANATAAADEEDGGENNNKRSKKLPLQVEARANQTEARRRSLGDVVDGAVGDVTGTVGDVTDTVGLKTRDGKDVRAEVTDDAALDAREKSKEAKSAAANGTAEARSLMNDGGAEGALAKKAANDTADAGAEARKSRKSRKSRKARKTRRSHQLW